MQTVKEFYEWVWAQDSVLSGAGEVARSCICSRSSLLPPPEIKMTLTIKNNYMEKTCKKCGRTLPIEEFAGNFRSSDGKMHICKECWAKVKAEGIAAAKDHKQAERVIELPAETVVVGTTTPDYAETMQTIEKSHESLTQIVAETKVQNEKIHELTLKALEVFDDDSLIQALRDRGFEGEIYKKFTL